LLRTLHRERTRLAESHRLRAYDAVHLASARSLSGRVSRSLVFASWDADLESAAAREGLEPLASTLDAFHTKHEARQALARAEAPVMSPGGCD
jgi:hypothetical protein